MTGLIILFGSNLGVYMTKCQGDIETSTYSYGAEFITMKTAGVEEFMAMRYIVSLSLDTFWETIEVLYSLQMRQILSDLVSGMMC
jgi:hypothetical protein